MKLRFNVLCGRLHVSVRHRVEVGLLSVGYDWGYRQKLSPHYFIVRRVSDSPQDVYVLSLSIYNSLYLQFSRNNWIRIFTIDAWCYWFDAHQKLNHLPIVPNDSLQSSSLCSIMRRFSCFFYVTYSFCLVEEAWKTTHDATKTRRLKRIIRYDWQMI